MLSREAIVRYFRKEFQIPRDLLKISLSLTILAVIGLVVLTWSLYYDSAFWQLRARSMANIAGMQLADNDYLRGVRRQLRSAPGDRDGILRKTQETIEGVEVWEWTYGPVTHDVSKLKISAKLCADDVVGGYNGYWKWRARQEQIKNERKPAN